MDVVMNTATIRSRIHEYVDRADNKHIEAMYILLKKEIEPSNQYDDETLEMLYQRIDNDKKGLSKSYSVEETLEYVRTAYKSKK